MMRSVRWVQKPWISAQMSLKSRRFMAGKERSSHRLPALLRLDALSTASGHAG